eukprot:3935648-Alexandrium_andersonii.AAC.1
MGGRGHLGLHDPTPRRRQGPVLCRRQRECGRRGSLFLQTRAAQRRWLVAAAPRRPSPEACPDCAADPVR